MRALSYPAVSFALLLGALSISAADAATTATASLPTGSAGANTLTSSAPTNYLVPEGCAEPGLFQGNTYYVDPVHGKITNAGTAAAPWDTLQDVMSKKQTLLKGGDTINLMSGNHGSVKIQNMVNSNFIKIQAASGQNPVLNYLYISGGQNFVIQGLKIQSLKTNLVTVGTSYTNVISKNIIFTDNTLSSQDDVSAWSKADWLANGSRGINVDGRPDVVDAASPIVNGAPASHHSTNCITISNNTITNVLLGVGMEADHSLFDSNSIDNYADDAVDFGGNYLTLSNNKVSNVNDTGNGNHNDAFQGFLPGGTGYNADSFSNVTIAGNVIIRQTNPNLAYPTVLQGIDNFDGGGMRDWYNLQVTNNTIITNTYNAITFGGIHDSVISNNTALADGMVTYALNAGSGTAPVASPGKVTNINIFDYNHFSHKSSNVSVTNNVTIDLGGGATDPSVTLSHNLASTQISLVLNGKPVWYSKPGTYGSDNILDPNFTANYMGVHSVNTTHGPLLVYDTTWKPNSPYLGMGSGVVAATPAYTGTISMLANARQMDAPQVTVLVNGVPAGSANITANVHTGQTGTYTVKFSSQNEPKTIDLQLSGFSSTYDVYNGVGVFKLDYTVNGSKAVDLQTAVPHKTTGNATMVGHNTSLYTNGSMVEYDVSGLVPHIPAPQPLTSPVKAATVSEPGSVAGVQK